jgi:hypothetical protein
MPAVGVATEQHWTEGVRPNVRLLGSGQRKWPYPHLARDCMPQESVPA